MYDYMRALEDRFNSKQAMSSDSSSKPCARRSSAQLDKEGRKKLLRLVDAHTLAQEDVSLVSSIAGFRPAWAFEMEREQVEATPAIKNGFSKGHKLPWRKCVPTERLTSADVKTVAGNTVTQLAMTQKHSNLQNVLAKVQKEHKEKLAAALERSGKIDTRITGQFTVGQWVEVWFENYHNQLSTHV